MLKFSIGCDPEFFLTHNNNYKSAVGLIGGSKWAPKPIDTDGHAILEDNVAVEFNTAPATSYEGLRGSIHKVLDHCRVILPDYEFSHASAVSFPPEELQTPEAQEFGCEPDYNAWTKKRNPKPFSPDENLRSAGGHIHVGSDIAKENHVEVIRAMDLFLGVPAQALDDGQLRKNLYGKAGCFRPKPYGCEYRTLSNFWIWDDGLIKWAFNGTQKALEFVLSGKKLTDEDGQAIQDCINKNDKEAFYHIVKRFAL